MWMLCTMILFVRALLRGRAELTAANLALRGEARRPYQRYRRQRDPFGEGHITTWRTMLIKVACEVIQSTRRILLRRPAMLTETRRRPQTTGHDLRVQCRMALGSVPDELRVIRHQQEKCGYLPNDLFGEVHAPALSAVCPNDLGAPRSGGPESSS